MEYQTLEKVISTLFPSHQCIVVEPMTPTESSIEAFTLTEVDAAMDSAKRKNKAPGLDGITSSILLAVHKANPRILVELFNK